MNAEQFFRLVESMRKAQKNYFQMRSTQYLNESKQLERQVDAEIERVNNILRERNMPKQMEMQFECETPPPPLEHP